MVLPFSQGTLDNLHNPPFPSAGQATRILAPGGATGLSESRLLSVEPAKSRCTGSTGNSHPHPPPPGSGLVVRKLINDPFSPSGPCSTSVTQSSHLALTTSCPPQPTNPHLANHCLFCPGSLPPPQATGLEKRFIQWGLPAPGASLHTAVCATSGL